MGYWHRYAERFRGRPVFRVTDLQPALCLPFPALERCRPADQQPVSARSVSTPTPKSKICKEAAEQAALALDEGEGISTLLILNLVGWIEERNLCKLGWVPHPTQPTLWNCAYLGRGVLRVFEYALIARGCARAAAQALWVKLPRELVGAGRAVQT